MSHTGGLKLVLPLTAIAFLVAACLAITDTFPCAQDGTCPPGYDCLSKTCVPFGSCGSVASSSRNCGACGNACNPGIRCIQGVCTCGASESVCDEGCTDTLSDEKNCRECGHTCDPGEICIEGRCACTATRCNRACVDTAKDVTNCGTCGNACPEGNVCESGACKRVGIICDVAKQDCARGKCVIYETAPPPASSEPPTYENRCVESGTKALDETCTRTTLGDDDCAKGLICTLRPLGTNQPPHCRKLCTVDAGCSGLPNNGTVAGACFSFGPKSDIAYAGACLPICSPFVAPCVSGTRCSPTVNIEETRYVPYCSAPASPSVDANTRQEGASCPTGDECRLELACAFHVAQKQRQCLRWCDNDHPCSGGIERPQTCVTFDGAPRGLGTCQ